MFFGKFKETYLFGFSLHFENSTVLRSMLKLTNEEENNAKICLCVIAGYRYLTIEKPLEFDH